MHKFFVAAATLTGLSSFVFADPGKNIVGYLGQATKPTTVYASPNSHSRRYARVPSHQYLVIRPYSSLWDKVLLNRGIYGYVKLATVNNLPYELSYKNARLRGGGSESPFPQGDLSSRSYLPQYAMKFCGKVPYRWGGTDASGIDCSGFVQKMYGKIGVRLPRTAAQQALVGQPIYRLEELQPGDRLYFWEAKRGMIGHTGIYAGNKMFVHSSHGKGGVATSELTQSWLSILVAARR